MKIRKKTWPDFFEQVLSGKKAFDIRLADWECQEGDVLVFEEWNPKLKKYTGRKIEKKVTLVVKTKDLPYWLESEVKNHGFQVIGLQ